MLLNRIPFILIALVVSCSSETKTDAEATPSPEVAAPAKVEELKEIDPKDDLGVGPVKSLTLAAIDEAMAAKGKVAFKAKCSACHKFKKRYVGPALAKVTERRTPEWIMNMILDPEGMIKNNAAAKKLLMEFSAPMANQNLTEEEARSILEYFRQRDAAAPEAAAK